VFKNEGNFSAFTGSQKGIRLHAAIQKFIQSFGDIRLLSFMFTGGNNSLEHSFQSELAYAYMFKGSYNAAYSNQQFRVFCSWPPSP
jgi:hypothetical protein